MDEDKQKESENIDAVRQVESKQVMLVLYYYAMKYKSRLIRITNE